MMTLLQGVENSIPTHNNFLWRDCNFYVMLF